MHWLLQRHSTATVLLLTFGSILSAAPRLVLSTSAIGPLYVVPGTNGPLQTVEAFNAGDGALSLTASTSASWLAASTGAQKPCTTQTGNCLPVSISLNTVSLPNGNYTEYVTVASPNTIDAPQQISVNVVVASIPSSITLYVSPNTGGTATKGTTSSVNVYPHNTVVGTVNTQSGGNWLSFTAPVDVFTFGKPAVITATALPGQAPGIYSGTSQLLAAPFKPITRPSPSR